MLRRLPLLLMLTFATLAVGQDSTTPQWQFYGGYQYTRLDSGNVQDSLNLLRILDPSLPPLNFGRHQSMNGWNFGVQENVNRWLSGIADFSGSYHTKNIDLGTVANIDTKVRTRLRFYTIMGGFQFTMRKDSRIQPFARVLIGGAFIDESANVLENNVPQFAETQASDSGFAVGGGGGADLFFSNHVGIRVSADYVRANVFGQSLNNYRGNAGLVFRLGSK